MCMRTLICVVKHHGKTNHLKQALTPREALVHYQIMQMMQMSGAKKKGGNNYGGPRLSALIMT